MITYGNDKFTINGRDTFLYGGEFHYFRVKRTEWQDRIDKIKAAGFNLISTYIPWRFHEPEEGRIDLTGETLPERDLETFMRLVRDSGMYCIVRPGPYIMAEVKNEGIPGWFVDRYPESLSLDIEGNPHPTKVVCYLHPTFLAKTKIWYRAVCGIVAKHQITKPDGSIIMFQLDNEIAMLHWVVDKSDYHPVLLERFREQLIGELPGEDWLKDEAAFADAIKRNAKSDPALFKRWTYFKRRYIREFADILKSYAAEFGIEVPYLINVHGFKDFSVYSRGTEYPIGLSQLYDVREAEDTLLAGDFYPGHIGYDTFHDLVLASVFTKSVQPPGQPLFSAEFQSGRLSDRPRVYPQDLDLNTRTCIASGMNALNFYMFCAGENYEEIGLFGRRHEWQAPIDSRGGFRPSYGKAKHLGRLLGAFGSDLVGAARHADTHIAFIPDYYVFGESEGAVRDIQARIAAEREAFGFDGVYRMLIAANYSVSAVNVQDERPIDPAEVPSLWVHATEYLDEAVQRRLLAYANAGGKLVLFPQLPDKDMAGRPCTVLADALGIRDWEIVEGMHTVDILDYDRTYANKYVVFEGAADRAFAWKDGRPIGFVQRAGGGEIAVLGAGMVHGYNHQLDMIAQLADKLGIGRRVSLDRDGATATLKQGGKGAFLFVNNYDESAKELRIAEGGSPLFGGGAVTVGARAGLALLLDYRLADGVTVEWTTGEIVDYAVEADRMRIVVDAHGETCKLRLRLDSGWAVRGHSQPAADSPQTVTLELRRGAPYAEVELTKTTT